MKYKHQNMGDREAHIYDSEGNNHLLHPGATVTIDRWAEGGDVFVVKEQEPKARTKKTIDKITEDD